MNFKYPFEYPNYECMNRFVEEISSCYQKEIMPLKNQYKTELLLFNSQKYAQLLSEKAKIDLKYIKQIINFFNPILKKRRHIIFIHGSYSKKLIRWRSDIDLNILYLKKFDNKYLILEELICAIIYKVLDYKGRDKVHTMMLYLPYLDKRFLVLPNEYAIEFKTNEKYKYSCRNNFENIFLKILNSSRKFSDFRQYILSFDNSCEWEYSYETLYKTNEDKLIKILTEKENKLNKINFCENLEKYYNKLNNEKCSMSEINIDLISNLNFKLKINNLNIIYTLLLYFKEFIVISGGKCLNLNVETIFSNEILINFLGKQILKKIQNHIYKYNWFLDRIENLCDYLNINFSSRETTNIDMKIFAKKYKTLYNSNLRKDYICFEKFKETAKLIIVRMMKEYEK